MNENKRKNKALIKATRNGNLKKANAAIENGANINAVDNNGIASHEGYTEKKANEKNKKTAVLLAIFLGGFGIHRFYLK